MLNIRHPDMVVHLANSKQRWAMAFSIAATVVLFVSTATGAPPKAGDDKADDFFNEVTDNATKPDLELLRASHLSDLTRWRGVQPLRAAAAEKETKFGWRIVEGAITPTADLPASTLVAVPEAGAYRVWVRYVAKPDVAQPMTLALGGANEGSHDFGTQGLSNADGRSQEQKRPIRFEAEFQRLAVPSRPLPIWEFWDVTLKPGATTLSLTSKTKDLRVDRVLLTRSKAFRPSLISDQENATLNRTYYRFRVVDAQASSPTHTLGGSLTYHTGRPPPRPGELIWYYPFFDSTKATGADGKSPITTGQWSAFIDVTDGISSPGTWATAGLGVSGIKRGTLEVQLAWYPHEGAVLKTIKPGVVNGSAVIMIPIDYHGYTCAVAGPDDKQGAWGMRTAAYLNYLETAYDVFQRHEAFAKAGLAELPKQGNPAPKFLRLSTGNGSAPDVRDATAAMLASIGINNIEGASAATREKLGLRADITLYANDALFTAGSHDPMDPLIESNLRQHFENVAKSLEANDPGSRERVVTLKMGDEIGAIVGPDRINGLPDARRAWHDYLREQLSLAGRDASFFGVDDVGQLDFSPQAPVDPGRFERRLYYHSARFNFVYTAMFYKRMTAAVSKVFPNVRTYCNFSPHPPMFGQHMNGSDWFALTREGGATLAWAEDWAGIGGGWGFAGIQTVTYYAALVECAARAKQLPAGFYVVTTMGAADRKLFSLVAHGVFENQLYSFGPMYAGAEASNFWDLRAAAYGEIARGSYALGPADEIIAKGKRDARRVALVYNRSHELWNAGTGGFQTDRLLTFIALKHAHVPVDIIIEEDLTPELLKQYRVVYTQGYNLADRHAEALRGWVEAGGTLVGCAGTAMRDEYDDASDAGVKLFGAKQRPHAMSTGSWHPQSLPGHKAIDKVKVNDSALTKAMEFDAIGVITRLEPTTAKPVATFADGSPAGVVNEIGKGKALLWGFTPGHIYKGDANGGNRYRLDRLPLIAKPALATLGEVRVVVSDPQVEVCFFEHESGLAVTMSEVAVSREPAKEQAAESGEGAPTKASFTASTPAAINTVTVSIKTDRAIKEVSTSFAGPVKWERKGDRIVVEVPLPKPVDVLILR